MRGLVLLPRKVQEGPNIAMDCFKWVWQYAFFNNHNHRVYIYWPNMRDNCNKSFKEIYNICLLNAFYIWLTMPGNNVEKSAQKKFY